VSVPEVADEQVPLNRPTLGSRALRH
jgi:hypothetical protein